MPGSTQRRASGSGRGNGTQTGARLHSLEREGERLRATLAIGPKTYVLSHRVVGGEPAEGYDPFLAAATPIAMRAGMDISVDGQVSPRLLAGLEGVERMLNGWYPELRRVAIEPRGAQAQVGTGNRGTACFFSGGLDSFYSVLTNLERLDALIFIHGFDAQLDDAETLGRVAPLVRKAAAGLGLPLVEVETDVKKVAKLYCRWGDQYHGALLASVAHVVSNRFERVLVPASAPAIRLHPWGSHPELDPLWSSELVELSHDGAVTRAEKIAVVKDSQVALDNLRVCFKKDTGRLNCGECEKCLRTMVGLRIVGALERCSTMPDEVPLDKLARMPIGESFLLERAGENAAAAEAAGDLELAAALRQMIREGPGRAAALEARRRRRQRWNRARRGLRRIRRKSLRLLRRARRGRRRRRS